MGDLDDDRAERAAAYDAGLAAWHAEHDRPAHLAPDAIAACQLCDPDGYRGTNICTHNPDQAAINANGVAACRSALNPQERPK